MSALVKLSRSLKTKTALIAGIAMLISALTAPQVASAVGLSTISCSISGSVTVSDDVVTSGLGCAGSVSIPSGITTIGNSAFGANQTLTSISFPATLTLIRNSAFGAAMNLRSISFEGHAPSLENSAFGGIASDAKVYITSAATGFGTVPGTWNGLNLALQPDAAGNGAVPCSTSGSVTVVNHVATGNTACAGSLTLPDVVTSIGASAFLRNTGLTSVNMPQVTTIGIGAFSGITSLTTASMPSAIIIGASAFEGNTSLTTVFIPSATTIGNYSFGRNSALTSVTMTQVTTLGEGAFYDDTALASVTMPRVTDIGVGAFYQNRALVSVDLPASLMSIGAYAFFGASTLRSISLAGNAPNVIGDPFSGVVSGATANITYPATGFGTEATWQGLLISRAAAPYVEPIVVREVPSISVTGITGSGGSRIITGTLLSSVTRVVVQGLSVSVSAQSDGSLTFIVPKLAAGRYDILISGTSGALTFQEALVIAAAPTLAKLSNLNIGGFSADSAKLTVQMKGAIKRVVSGFGAKGLTCAPGASRSKLSATQQKLAIARAKAVCAYAANLAPRAKLAISPRVFERVGAKDNFVRISLIG